MLQLVTYDEEEWSSDNIQVGKNIHEHTNIDNDIDADIDAEIDYIDADDIVENDKHEDKDQVMRKTLVWKNVPQIDDDDGIDAIDDIDAINDIDADIVEYDKFEDKN